jgi:TRAP-type mannitol/chloroaromatic compound transport system permease small subunit
MRQTSSAVARHIEAVIDRIGHLASTLVLVIIVLMVCNVLLRYSMSIGAVWSQELEWHLLAALILFGMSYSLQRGDNVRVDIFYSKYSDKTKRVVNIVSTLLTMVIAGVMIYLSSKYVQQSFAIAEQSPDPGGIPMRWVVKGLIPVGYGLLMIQAFGQLIRLIRSEAICSEEAPNA